MQGEDFFKKLLFAIKMAILSGFLMKKMALRLQ